MNNLTSKLLRKDGGVVVAGQPGIGMDLFPVKIILLTSS
jgi:hypothetical protein